MTKKGTTVIIPVSEIEFVVGSNTMWIHDRRGGTALRIKTSGKILIEECNNSPLSHCDILVAGDISMCLSDNAKY